MANTEGSLKQKNAPFLWSFFFFNLFAFVLFFFSINYEAVANKISTLLTFRSFGVCVAPLVIFLFNGLLTPNQKAIIVFWRVRNVLPGNRAFTFHAHRDNRIDIHRLTTLHPNIPTDERGQNNLWYKIYKSNIEEITVKKSHKDFLLARDLTSMSFLFLILIGMPGLFFITGGLKWYYFIYLLVQYLLMTRIAQNHGRAFVKNVLAIESTK